MQPPIHKTNTQTSRQNKRSSSGLAITMIAVLLASVVGVFLSKEFADAATVNFTQSSWTGGATVNTATGALNQTGWTQYEATADVSASSSAMLATASKTFTDDGVTTSPGGVAPYGGGFGNGVVSGAAVYGSGAGATIQLSPKIGQTAISTNANRIAYDSSTHSVWVSAQGTIATADKVDVNTGTRIGTYTAGTTSFGLAFATSSVWIANANSYNVTQLNAADGSTIGTYPVPGGNVNQIAFATSSLWITNISNNIVNEISAYTGAVIGSFTVSGPTKGVAFATSTVWVTHNLGNTVTELDANSGSILGDYTVGVNPAAVIYDPVTNSMWVANSGSNNVVKINANTGAIVGTYSGGGIPAGLAFDSTSNSVWLLNQSGPIDKYNIFTGARVEYPIANNTDTLGGIAFDNLTNSIWVTDDNTNMLLKVDTSGAHMVSGSFVSAFIDFGETSNFNTFSFTRSTPTNTTLTLDVRGSIDGATWTSWITNASSGADISALNGNRYIQYRANLATADAMVTPSLSDVSISTNYWTFVDGGVGSANGGVATSGGGFLNGINSGTAVSGTGTGASVGLSTSSTYPTGAGPAGITFDAASSTVWTADNGFVNTVTKLNASTGSTLGTYSVGGSPLGVVFDSTNNAIWTANKAFNGTVTKVDASTGATIGTYAAGNQAWAIAFDSTNNAVWVVGSYIDASSGKATKLNAATGALISTYSSIGVFPKGVAFDVTNNAVWVTSSGDNTILKLNAATGALISTSTVGVLPIGAAFDVTNNAVWVANSGDNTVTKLNATTGAVIGTYTGIGLSPSGITFDVTNDAVWVTSTGDNTILKLNASTGAVLGTYSVGGNPLGAVFDAINNAVWVTNNNDSTVTRLNATGAFGASGTFTSAQIDLGAAVASSTLSYTATLPALTSITIDVQGSVDNVTWSPWVLNVANGGSLNALDGDRYFQYRANLSTTDTAVTPTLNDITINYLQYKSSGTLTSSVYDSGASANTISKVAWVATGITATEDINFQIRSSPDGIAWSNWCGASTACSGADYFLDADNGVTFASGHPLSVAGSNRYFQYKVTLYSGGGATPTLTSVSVFYDAGTVVAPPAISSVASSGITATVATITWNTTTAADSYVQYSTSPSLMSPTTVGDATLATSHSVNLSGLTAGTTYYYEVQSTDATSQLTTDTNGGSYYTFTTTAATLPPPTPTPIPAPTPVTSGGSGGSQHPLPLTPSVTTGSSTAITSTGVTLNGYVDPNTSIDTTRWFEWGTSASLLSNKTVPVRQGPLAGYFSETLSSLTAKTVYYFRAVAKNSLGTMAGFTGTFTVGSGFLKPPPPVISNVATGISTCRIPFSWDITGASAPNIYNATKGIQYTDAISGEGIHFPIIHGVNIIQIRDGGTVLKTLLINCSYAS